MAEPLQRPASSHAPPLIDHADDTGIELEVLINPDAGNRELLERYRHVALRSRKSRLTEVTSPDETRQLFARFAERPDKPRVAMAGGDGTMNKACAINAALDHPLEMALLACGTANDFVQALGIPVEPTEAWRVARHGRTRDVTLGHCVESDHVFGNIASGGISHTIVERLKQRPELKQAWGRLVYTRVAAAEAMHPEQYTVTLTLDGREETHTAEALLIANSPRTGGQVLVPVADAFEPRLDVMLLTTSSLGERVDLLASLMRGDLIDHPLCCHRQVTQVAVHAEPAMRFVLDGEPLERSTPLTFAVHPRRIPMAVDV